MFTVRLRWAVPVALAVGLVPTNWGLSQDRPVPPPAPAAGADQAQELTRGPIHEAFGQPMVFDPRPGPVVSKRPPELINEVPPDLRPEGDNVAWMPGYWGWDDEGKRFVWVSGFWRYVPPGRTWVPGYWNTTDDGYQWVCGFWAPNTTTEIDYLPPPPESVEAGPVAEATADGQVWIPGVWVWRETRYWWRPGFWTAANADWVWVPAHYQWSPSGYVFVDGYWDYPLFNRGLLFTPVTFTAIPAGYTFTPTVTIDVRSLAGALFSRPATDHYYFGDFYADSYARAGIYPWFAFHNSRLGYDPLFAQTEFIYARRDPQWADRVRSVYFDRREHAADRPPHTYSQFRDWARKIDPDGRNAVAFALPLNDIQRTPDYPVRLDRLDDAQRRTVATQATQVQKYRGERILREQQAARELPRTTADPKSARTTPPRAPVRVKMPDAPRLAALEPGVGGAVPPRTGRTGPRVTPPPDAPRVPALGPATTTPTTPKTPARQLPNPEDNLRLPTGPRAPGSGPDREVIPPGRREVPEGPSRLAPPVKEPPPARPPVKGKD